MKILTVLTYYRPHTSGLTIYVERLAKSLVKLGHEVTVLTSQYDKSLPQDEIQDGVRIIRAPVLFRVSKGVIMPTIGWLAWKLVSSHDVVHLHLPQFDAAGIALRGRILKKPTPMGITVFAKKCYWMGHSRRSTQLSALLMLFYSYPTCCRSSLAHRSCDVIT